MNDGLPTKTEPKAVVRTDGTVMSVDVPKYGTVLDQEWEQWFTKQGITVNERPHAELVIDGESSRISGSGIKSIVEGHIPTGVRTVIQAGSVNGSQSGSSTLVDTSNEETDETDDDSTEAPPETGFDWTDMPLEDRLHWVEHWDDVDEGKITDVEYDDETFYVTVRLPWGETFTEEYDLPIPGDPNTQLTKLAEHCGYNLKTVEEIGGSTAPIVTNADTDEWMIARNPRPAAESTDETPPTKWSDFRDYYPHIAAAITILFVTFIIGGLFGQFVVG